jgi:hypothetical protein
MARTASPQPASMKVFRRDWATAAQTRPAVWPDGSARRGVSRNKLTAAINTIVRKIAIFASSKRPYSVPIKVGTVPARNQVFTRPAENRVATLVMASTENCRVAARVIAPQLGSPMRLA